MPKPNDDMLANFAEDDAFVPPELQDEGMLTPDGDIPSVDEGEPPVVPDPDEEALLSDGENEPPVEEGTEEPTLKALLDLVTDLKTQIADLKQGKTPDESPTPDPVAAIQPVTPKDVAISLTDEDFESLSGDREGASKVLAGIINQSNKALAASLHERYLQDIPQVLVPAVARMVASYGAKDRFESDPKNADLLSFKNPKVQQRVYGLLNEESNRLATANPTWEPLRVFNEAGKSVRAQLAELRLQAGTSPAAPEKDKKPPVRPAGGGGRTSDKKPNLTAFQKELLADLRPGWK